MNRISVCMIVKNEEDILRRCLDSLRGIWDELIIVDTGSSDETKAVAAEYTDKIYDFAWTGSFSDARNFAFSKAQMEYIYSADADEVLDEENRARFLTLKETLLPEVEIVQMKYGNQLAFGTVYNFDEEYRPKLFRRQRTFQWIEAIHETIRTEPVIFDSDIVITHMPKGSHAARDLQAFERLVGKGERLSPRLFEMYARELFVSGTDEDFIRAEAYFQSAAADPERKEGEILMAACAAAAGARARKDSGAFFKYALKAVALNGCSEICLELGRFYMDAGDLEEAAIWLYNAVYETEPVLNIHAGGDVPLSLLADCYRICGNGEQAKIYEQLRAQWVEEHKESVEHENATEHSMEHSTEYSTEHI